MFRLLSWRLILGLFYPANQCEKRNIAVYLAISSPWKYFITFLNKHRIPFIFYKKAFEWSVIRV